MAQTAEPGNGPGQQRTARLGGRNPVVITTLILLAVIAGMYTWKEIALARAKADAQAAIAKQNQELIRLVSVPLVWAVRAEMIRGNYDQIDQYVASLVREPNIPEVALAGRDGKIILASDKNLEGRPATDRYPADVLQVDQTKVTRLDQKGLVAASPILGLNRKLAVLIVVFRPPKGPW